MTTISRSSACSTAKRHIAKWATKLRRPNTVAPNAAMERIGVIGGKPRKKATASAAKTGNVRSESRFAINPTTNRSPLKKYRRSKADQTQINGRSRTDQNAPFLLVDKTPKAKLRDGVFLIIFLRLSVHGTRNAAPIISREKCLSNALSAIARFRTSRARLEAV